MRLVYIIGTYPSLTTTFIDREVRALRALDAEPAIISIRRPRGRLSLDQERTRGRVIYLLPCKARRLLASHFRFALLKPLKYFGTLIYLLTRRHPDWKSRLMTFLHFGEGVVAARLIETLGGSHIHAHFVDRAATLALTAGRLLALPYSVTAHANDIYVRPVLLAEKVSGARFVATCTEYNKAHLTGSLKSCGNTQILCIYHGLDMRRYQPPVQPAADPPLLVAVGQLKEKKGFAYLLRACKVLRDRGYRFQCHVVGEGPLRTTLEEQIRQLSLDGTVTLFGALSHHEVVEKYRQAAVFVLPCVVAADGDRDGIPNVILEAMAMELPVVATTLSGIPEAIDHEVNGKLVPPGNETLLAEALAELLDDPDRRRTLGEHARRTVAERFDAATNARTLFTQFMVSNVNSDGSRFSTPVGD